jgi:hypothetical protein
MPALHLARLDMEIGATTEDQQVRLRDVISTVVTAIGSDKRRFPRPRRHDSVLDNTNMGRLLRRQREQLSGPWQGPLAVQPGSVILCLGLGTLPDDFTTELLVRVLRDQKMDARHFSVGDLERPPPGASADAVSIVCLVSAFPCQEREQGAVVAEQLRTKLPHACIMTVFLPGWAVQAEYAAATPCKAHRAAMSFAEAVQICRDWQQARSTVAGTTANSDSPVRSPTTRSST